MRRGLWDNIRCEKHFGLWQFSACEDEKKKIKKNVPVNQWSVPAILLFAKNADYKNEKCLKIKVFFVFYTQN